jgi:uncharacterized protein YdeI (YjbR/CyaY-like superfamily)
MASSRLDALERVQIESAADLRRWLKANHTRTESVWLVHYKKSAGSKYVPYGDIVDEALCFGWIDGLARGLDDRRSMLLFSPRRPRSVWSRINKQRVERLIAERRMTPHGMAKIEEAKRDGSWDLLTGSDNLTVPPELARAFEKNKGAARKFAALSESVRRRLLATVALAKRPETRAKRVREVIEISTRATSARGTGSIGGSPASTRRPLSPKRG